MLIDLKTVRDRWRACRPEELLAELYDSPKTPMEVLTLKDGPWADVSVADRFWTVLRQGVLPDRLLRLFACWCARQVLGIYEAQHPEDFRPRKAIEAAEAFADEKISEDELDAASVAARDAAWAAAWAAAMDAAWAAARSASWYAAWAAARSASWYAARAVARDAASVAASVAARDEQLNKLLEMITDAN